MTDYKEKYGLKVSDVLCNFVQEKALAGTGLSSDIFWKGLSDMVKDLAPVNRALIEKRREIQDKIDA